MCTVLSMCRYFGDVQKAAHVIMISGGLGALVVGLVRELCISGACWWCMLVVHVGGTCWWYMLVVLAV